MSKPYRRLIPVWGNVWAKFVAEKGAIELPEETQAQVGHWIILAVGPGILVPQTGQMLVPTFKAGDRCYTKGAFKAIGDPTGRGERHALFGMDQIVSLMEDPDFPPLTPEEVEAHIRGEASPTSGPKSAQTSSGAAGTSGRRFIQTEN